MDSDFSLSIALSGDLALGWISRSHRGSRLSGARGARVRNCAEFEGLDSAPRVKIWSRSAVVIATTVAAAASVSPVTPRWATKFDSDSFIHPLKLQIQPKPLPQHHPLHSHSKRYVRPYVSRLSSQLSASRFFGRSVYYPFDKIPKLDQCAFWFKFWHMSYKTYFCFVSFHFKFSSYMFGDLSMEFSD